MVECEAVRHLNDSQEVSICMNLFQIDPQWERRNARAHDSLHISDGDSPPGRDGPNYDVGVSREATPEPRQGSLKENLRVASNLLRGVEHVALGNFEARLLRFDGMIANYATREADFGWFAPPK